MCFGQAALVYATRALKFPGADWLPQRRLIRKRHDYSYGGAPRRFVAGCLPSRATAEDDARSRNNLLGHADALD
jgi:hypothetical protein